MAYYCVITGVTRTQPETFTVAYNLMDDTANPDAVVESRSLGMPFDPRLLDAAIPLTEKRRFIIDQLESTFRQHIDQVRAGDAAFAQIQAALVGRRYPEA